MFDALPWYLYPVVIGIIFSGYMVLYWNRKENEEEQFEIEQEGEIYMERIRKAKEVETASNR